MTSLSSENFVPFTARMMAAIRALEQQQTNPLFQDLLAEQLAGEEALVAIQERLTSKDLAYVAIRTHYFDQFLTQHPAPQVVILASGLDTRAYRLPWPKNTVLFELDHEGVLAYKTAQLQDQTPACELHLLGMDLTQSHWGEALQAKGYNPTIPSVWLVEGLLMYLEEEQVRAILKQIAALTTRQSYLGLDLINQVSVNYAPYQGYFRSGWDEPEVLLAEYGWQGKVSQPGEPDTHPERYPWTFPPRDQPNVERVFLIQCERIDTPAVP
ncbi:SAM-dependent methyltransferase [Spirulina subsalsa FACHB-351]|uniref:S-adenosyl-L-methionine-dependent methyltransferase n=1 Tax=Spirulina subsalsa FACHB-351 TaxID=234711 RepID=A0ABT3L5Y6_9CYAN|nr:SAM-dependent methyltransferase [Spirulina subsalsa]MCW6036597.1 SAM-dependent methyltransferase [Spirulina subsalsa FACHB-351]